MLTPEELDGKLIEFDGAGKPVLPEGYKTPSPELRDFQGICFQRGDTNWLGGSTRGGFHDFVYGVPDPDYKPGKVVAAEDPILAAFNGAIKDLEEELQDTLKAKEVHLRMSQDAETFNALAEKYGWYEKEEGGV